MIDGVKRSLALAFLGLWAGCIAAVQTAPIPPGYEYCEYQTAYSPSCNDYYYWVGPSYTVYGYWHPGHWAPRPGYRSVRDHRR